MTAIAENTRYKVSFPRVLRSEWTKMFSLRSNWIVLIGVPVLLAGLAAGIGLNNRGGEPAPTQAVAGGFLLYAMAIGVFGVLMMTSEFNSGLIRQSLLAVPTRLPLLWAKAIALLTVTAPITVLAYFASFFAHEAFAEPGVRLLVTDPGIVAAIFGAAGATVAAGLIGLAIGTFLRSTPVSIFTFVFVLVVLPQILVGALPESAQDDALPLVPTLALQAMFQVGSDAHQTGSPLKGAITVAAWVVVLLGASAAVLHRRDP